MFRKYDYVLAVYQTGSFTKAAESLYISQPSLSVAVRKIEKEVGAPLFDRIGGGATLTEIGREYVAAAEQIRRTEQEFINRIHDICELESGTLAVGGTNYLCSYVLPRIITRFKARYPKIDVTLTEANSAALGELLERERVDIIVDSFDENMDLYQGTPLVSEQILLCLPQDRPINNDLQPYAIRPQDVYDGKVDLASTPAVPIRTFRKEPFILLKSGNDMYRRAERIFQKNGITPQVLFHVDQLNISYALAASGSGACFVTDTLFKFARFNDRVVLYNIDQEHNSRTLHIAYKKNKYCTTAMSKFIELAQEVIHPK